MTYKEARAILPLEHICNEFARQKALEALDKQIPKKPTPKIEGAYGSVSCDEAFCPTCSRYIHPYNDYCFHCGQALDWSDEK